MPELNDSLIKTPQTHFESFIQGQDKVPSKEFAFPSDSLYKHLRITTFEPTNTKEYVHSLFEHHTLHPRQNYTQLNHIQKEHWIFGVFIICIIIIIIAKLSYVKRLNHMFKSFIADRFINQLIREGYIFFEKTSLLLFINYILTISLAIYFFIFTISKVPHLGAFFFLEILFYILVFYIIKINTIHIIGRIFESDKETDDHILLIHIYNQIGGIILLPLIFIIYYTKPSISITLMYLCLLGGIINYLFKLFRVLLSSANKSRFSKFYLFLYLCTLEILPVLIVAKYLMNNFKAV